LTLEEEASTLLWKSGSACRVTHPQYSKTTDSLNLTLVYSLRFRSCTKL